MRLADVILRDMEPILANWQAFAATQLPAAEHMSDLALRDHARQILEAIAEDLCSPQGGEAQDSKSWGLAARATRKTAAEIHAVLRARSGFHIDQLAAEYRALRASVLRCWVDATQPNHEDMIRFNEAVDQALAESIHAFSEQQEQARHLLLGMIGHDMRTPLQVIQMTAAHLQSSLAPAKASADAARIIRSGRRMQELLDDLIDYNRAALGIEISVSLKSADLAAMVEESIDQLRAAYPNRSIELAADGECTGVWDGPRLQRVVDNLVINAVKHGGGNDPVSVSIVGRPASVRIEVLNFGPEIEKEALERIFEPLQQGWKSEKEVSGPEGMGLGLYIAKEIVKAHGGDIAVRSAEGQTRFVVTLPR